jgi:excisionase family DNA binding protein
MFSEYNDIVTVKELAMMLKIGRNTAYELVRCGAVRSIKVGRQIRISKNDVMKYITTSNNSKTTKYLH